jgi:cytochrome c biogenesis protein ResB
MSSSPTEKSPGTLATLSSIQFGLVALTAITVVAVIGTIIPQGRPLEFYREQYGAVMVTLITIFRLDTTYTSPLFIGLLGLFGLNLILCTAKRFPLILKTTFHPDTAPVKEGIAGMPIRFTLEKISLDDIANAFSQAGFPLKKVGESRLFGEKRWFGYLGSSLVHLSILILLAGGMVSLASGKRASLVLENGQIKTSAELPDGSMIPLGFTVRLDSFTVAFYDKYPGRPKSYTSSVTVTPLHGAPFKKDIRVNHPLMFQGLTVFQSSYGRPENNPAVSSVSDTVRIEVRLKGSPEKMPPLVTWDMTLGVEKSVPGFGDSISVRLSEIHRDLQMGGPSGKANPAVKLDVIVHGNISWSVYAFQNFPGLNMPMNPNANLTFSLLDMRTGGAPPSTEMSPGYYTVLGVVRDRGLPLMGFGALLIMAGFFLSFYYRPKRLWVLEEEGKIYIGAQVKGDMEPFRDWIKNCIKNYAGNGRKTGDKQ